MRVKMNAVRVLPQGDLYVRLNDVLLWLTSLGERHPHTAEQLAQLEALIKDLRGGTEVVDGPG